MRLVGYDRVPARLPRGQRARRRPARRRSPIARATCWRRWGCTRSSAGASCPRGWLARWLGGATAAARRGHRGQEPDLGRLRGDAHVAAARRWSRRPRRNLARGVADVGAVRGRPGRAAAAPTPRSIPVEPTLAAGDPGRAARPSWLKPGAAVDFFDAKRVADRAAARARRRRRRAFVPRGGAALLHPGVSAPTISRPQGDGRAIGLVGEVHPRARARASASRRGALYFEVDARRRRGRAARAVPACRRRASPPRRATSRSGSTRRVTADEQRAALAAAAEPLLRELAVLEDFRDPQLRAGRARRGCSGR